ncbi:MAG: glycosyltransferase family 2 protein [Eubacteriales bacterium]|nr:glycosyltransferase family 2 protein [Eubacteriales bacterium]
MNELISIIITTYGRSFSMVERCLKSVLAQTYSPTEIIVVDDNGASSPLPVELAAGLQAYPAVKYLAHEKNSGAQRSRNDGVALSQGSWLAFIDDDDLWLPQKLEKQAELIDPSVGLIYCKGWACRKNPDGTTVRKPYNMSAAFLTSVDFEDLLYGDYIGTTSQALIARKAIEACGSFDIQQVSRQDYEMWLRISRRFHCVGADEYLFEHWVHDGEQISKGSRRGYRGLLQVYEKYKADYRAHPLARSHLYLGVARHCKGAKEYLRACSYVLRSVFVLVTVPFVDRAELKKRLQTHQKRVSSKG